MCVRCWGATNTQFSTLPTPFLASYVRDLVASRFSFFFFLRLKIRIEPSDLHSIGTIGYPRVLTQVALLLRMYDEECVTCVF